MNKRDCERLAEALDIQYQYALECEPRDADPRRWSIDNKAAIHYDGMLAAVEAAGLEWIRRDKKHTIIK